MTAARRLLLLLAVLGLFAAGAPAAAASGGTAPADRVVVIGVPGLVWDDVDPAATPQLASLADSGAIGALSVRAARARTCVLDGWATLGAGNRAAYPEPAATGGPADPADAGDAADAADSADAAVPDPADPGTPPGARCSDQERQAGPGLTDPQAAAARVAADAATARFGSVPGALGTAVGCATAVGGGAVLAAAAPGVSLATAPALPPDRAGLTALLSGCPLALVSLDALVTAGPGDRSRALGDVDDAVGRVRASVAALPGRTLLLLVGVADVDDGRPALHVAIASGPGFDRAAQLRSSSTGRAPFVQLIDVAPTVLAALGRAEPPAMNGQPMVSVGGRPALAEAVTDLRAAAVGAAVHYRSTGLFFWLLVGLDAALVVAGMVLLGTRPGRRWRPAGRTAGRARAALRTVALALGALPAATYLAGVVPWEGTGRLAQVLVAAVVAADLVLLAIAALGPWRRYRLGPELAVITSTAVLLVSDVVGGSRLELNGLLGYDAIVAGRFTGLGNLGSALLSTAALLVVAALATALARRSRAPRAVLLAVALGAGLLAVVLIGAPGLGRDFGGVLATLPGFLVLAMLLAGIRITPARLAAVLGAGVVAVGTLAYLDWLRPAGERSHLGRFVEQLRTGEAWTVVSRKAQANLSILLHSPLAWGLAVAAVAAWWLVRPGGLLRSQGGHAGAWGPDRGAVRAALLACALTLAVGTAVNDSGVAVPAAAAALLVPLMVATAAGRVADDAPDGNGGTAVSAGGGHPGGVTVGSRGSTAWNA